MGLDNSLINIKKRFTYKRNSKSKVLEIYTIYKDADKIDEELCKFISPRYQYLSY